MHAPHSATTPFARRASPALVAATSIAAAVSGCASPAPARPGVDGTRPPALAAAARPTDDASPVLVVDGEAITRSALWPDLAESGGGAIVRELVLDIRLRKELAAKGLRVDAAAIEHERALLADSLAVAGATGARADELVLRLRRGQGLGERRFLALLERTAMLRTLVQGDVTVSDATVAQAYAIGYGPRHRVRMIVVPTQLDASGLRRELLASGDHLSSTFSRLAIERSVDDSAASGGVLPALSTEDPLWPSALRAAIAGLKPGELSPVLGLERGYAIVLVDAVIPASATPTDQVRPTLERQVRLRQERLLMDRAAARLLQGGDGVRVLDPSLQWGWSAAVPPAR